MAWCLLPPHFQMYPHHHDLQFWISCFPHELHVSV
jgi:hypothetical protein